MSSDLGMNKIFGAVLATGLVILGLRQVSEMAFTVKPPAKAGYAVTVEEAATEGAAPADTPPDWGTVLPTADAAAGQTVSTKCASCHNFVAGGPDMTGPNLYGVLGRKPATHPGFAYSSGMTAEQAKMPVWDYDHLYMFLANPQAYVAGTKMTFVGLKKPEDRINLIAWLRQQSASPLPIPAPNPKAAAAPAAATTAAPAPAGAAVPAPPAASVAAGTTGSAPSPSAAAPAAPTPSAATVQVPGGKKN
ncbi:MAG TPA: cytochrome c family protein [Caulobacteraceae bacterium]|nr:cytochrome c family protein [Caulobacteraceae bacterium]